MNGSPFDNRIRDEAENPIKNNGGIIMRKIFTGILAAILTLSVVTANAFAACPGTGCNYADTDGDGICDYVGHICSYLDANGDGICDYCNLNENECGRGNGRGNGFRGGCGR